MFQLWCRQKSTNTKEYAFAHTPSLSLSLCLAFAPPFSLEIRYHLIQLSKWTTRHFHRNKVKWFTTMLTTYYTINAATILIFEPNLIYKCMHACGCVQHKTTHRTYVWQNTLVLHLCKLKQHEVKLCKPNRTKQHDVCRHFIHKHSFSYKLVYAILS